MSRTEVKQKWQATLADYGRCQASWHVSGKNYAACCTSWVSGFLLCGLSDTDCTGNQFLVCPDHRSGWRLFAAS